MSEALKNYPQTQNTSLPTLPSDYEDVFSRCISLAEPKIGDHLADILNKLQVSHARVSRQSDIRKPNIVDYLYDVGEIKASIDIIFPAARGEENFEAKKISRGDIDNAHRNLKIHKIPELKTETDRRFNNQ